MPQQIQTYGQLPLNMWALKALFTGSERDYRETHGTDSANRRKTYHKFVVGVVIGPRNADRFQDAVNNRPDKIRDKSNKYAAEDADGRGKRGERDGGVGRRDEKINE